MSDEAKVILNGVKSLTYDKKIDIINTKLSVFGENATVLAIMEPTYYPIEGESPAVASAVTENGNKAVVFTYSSFDASKFTLEFNNFAPSMVFKV